MTPVEIEKETGWGCNPEAQRRTFDALVRRYYPRLYHFIARRVGFGPDAEDLTQEALLKAYQAWGALRDKARFQGWLWQIAANLCASWGRRMQKQQAHEVNAQINEKGEAEAVDFDQFPDPSLSPAAVAEYDEFARSARAAIATLPMHCRQIVHLTVWEGMSPKEISERSHVPVGTVKSRLFRARARLTRKLQPWRALLVEANNGRDEDRRR